MRISAKVDYAVRAAIELAVAGEGQLTKADAIAQAQDIPPKFLENILGDLRQGGLVRSQRGAEGGYRLARPAGEITVADVIRVVEGPMASVRGGRPEDVEYAGNAEPLRRVWIAVRQALREVNEHVTLADLASGRLPRGVEALTRADDAWITR
jgi:Rrf2 family protein